MNTTFSSPGALRWLMLLVIVAGLWWLGRGARRLGGPARQSGDAAGLGSFGCWRFESDWICCNCFGGRATGVGAVEGAFVAEEEARGRSLSATRWKVQASCGRRGWGRV